MIRWLSPGCLLFASICVAPLAAAATVPATASTAAPAASAAATAPAATTSSAAYNAPAIVGNAAAGRSKVYTCHGCHGIPGYDNAYPNYHVPRIAGQNQKYLMDALHDYQSGNRSHPTMDAQAESLSDQDIADIAAYLSSFAKQ